MHELFHLPPSAHVLLAWHSRSALGQQDSLQRCRQVKRHACLGIKTGDPEALDWEGVSLMDADSQCGALALQVQVTVHNCALQVSTDEI